MIISLWEHLKPRPQLPAQGNYLQLKLKPTGEYQQINEFSPDTLKQGETFGKKIEVSSDTMVVSASSKVIYTYELKKNRTTIVTC